MGCPDRLMIRASEATKSPLVLKATDSRIGFHAEILLSKMSELGKLGRE